jgi:hypothetical protein
MFKILSTYICIKISIKCNIWRVAVRPSYIQDARFLKVNYSVVVAIDFVILKGISNTLVTINTVILS